MVVDLGGSRSWSAPPGRADSRLLYEQVVAYVEDLVAERGLVPGDMLPTYAELAASTGVSLITVRRALDELEKAGRVRRHQGRGTFLARPRIVTEPAGPAACWGHCAPAIPARRLNSIDTRVVDICRGIASAGVASALRIDPADAVWRLRRQRLVDGQPAVTETSIIPVALAPRLDHQVIGLKGSLYDLLAHDYGLEDDYEEQYLEVVVTPGPDERKLLGIPARTPVVRIRGLSMDKSGIPFDCFEHLYRATEFAFAISGSTSRQLFPAPAFQDWDVRAVPEGPVPRTQPGRSPGATRPH